MNRRGLIVLSALALVAIAGLGFSAGQPATLVAPAANVRSGETLLSATGDALVSRKPDRAVVTLGATVTEATSAAAQNNLNKKMDAITAAITAAIKAQQIPGVVIQTEWLNLQPQWDYQRPEQPRITGYTASNTLRIQLSDPGQSGKVIDAAISAGSNSIGGISFELTDDKAARAEAIKAASQDARAKVEAMADALGLRLVRVVDASTGGATMPPPRPYPMGKVMTMRAGMEATPTPIESGQIEISAQVTVTFASEPIK
jgi:uncharacterized protein YggE